MDKIKLNKWSKIGQQIIISQLLVALVGGFLMAPLAVQAVDPLVISQISYEISDTSTQITWQTNKPAMGQIDYGLFSGRYSFRLATNQNQTSQTMTLQGLFPETTYFFQIKAYDNLTEVVSFEQSFKTQKFSDSQSPTITNVSVVYLTGSTATIQWETDEPATSEVAYGLSTSYGSVRSDGRLVRIHDLTLTGLISGATYQFLVKSKDGDNNISRWYNLSFRTALTNKTDNDQLIVYDVRPTSQNDSQISDTSAIISWRTNKLAEGFVRFGEGASLNQVINAPVPRDFSHSVTLTNLKSGTAYSFTIEVKDVLGKTVKSEGHSFVTQSASGASVSPAVPPVGGEPVGQVLGSQSCDASLLDEIGFFGTYFNLPQTHPDVEIGNRGGSPLAPAIGRETGWYRSEYFAFDRVDPNLNFEYFTAADGASRYFSVHWRAAIEVPQSGSYSFKVTSDDDSWLFLDNNLLIDLGGLHSPKTGERSFQLAAGLHQLDIYFADRSRWTAFFNFQPDPRLKFHPLPEPCTLADLSRGSGQPQPRVLGVSNFEPAPVVFAPAYVCNPDLGYTKFKALYKTTASPDVWAILETGQKHYITSPESFALYQCDWREVKTVSQLVLDRYASATLVRTPANPVVYHLFQRPERQWLKINIPSPTVFISYPNNFWGNVARINQLDIDSYPDVKLIKAAGGSDVYFIEGSSKHLIPSTAVFEQKQFEWFEVVELNQMHWDSYQTGLPLQ